MVPSFHNESVNLRTFVSVPVSHGLAATGTDFGTIAAQVDLTIVDAMSELTSLGPGVRQVIPQNLHITLNFLGATDSDCLGDVVAAMMQAARSQPAFTWQIKGVGVFPDQNRPKVVWAAITPTQPFRHLSATVGSQLQPQGFRSDSRPYTPHLTLARIKGTAPDGLAGWLDRHQRSTMGVGLGNRLDLVMSERTAIGSDYSVLESVPLLQ